MKRHFAWTRTEKRTGEADLSGGISVALTTTAAGLCVAIPSLIAYNYLVTRVEAFCVDMEKAASEIIYFFNHHKEGRDADEK